MPTTTSPHRLQILGRCNTAARSFLIRRFMSRQTSYNAVLCRGFHTLDAPLPTPSRQHPAQRQGFGYLAQAGGTRSPNIRYHVSQIQRMCVRIAHDRRSDRHTVLPARLSATTPLGLPSFTLRASATATAYWVSLEIAFRTACATGAKMPTVRSLGLACKVVIAVGNPASLGKRRAHLYAEPSYRLEPHSLK